MTRTSVNRLLSAIFSLLAFILIVTETVLSASASLVSQELRQKAQREGEVRVIVRLAVSEVAAALFDSDILSGLRHANIAQAQNSVRAGLLGIAHRVHHQYRDIPFIVLQLGIDGLQTLDSLQGLVTEVLEDSLNRPLLAESVPLVQADQVWAGGFGGVPYDGSGTVVAVLDTGVDKNHPFLSNVVEEACFSSNSPSDGATSVCPGGVSICPGVRIAMHYCKLQPRHSRLRNCYWRRSKWYCGGILRRS